MPSAIVVVKQQWFGFGEYWAVSLSPGILNQLKETFTHTPSYDMSPAMLSMLIRLMLAQAQECLFEKTALPGIRNEFNSLMKMAQEAAKVSSSKDAASVLIFHHLNTAGLFSCDVCELVSTKPEVFIQSQ